MNIKTKFDLGQSVYFMQDNTVHNGIISCVETFNVGTNQDQVTYNAKQAFKTITWLDYTNLKEKNLFATKEECLANL